MDEELEETVRKVAEYSNEDKLKVTRRIHLLFIGGVIAGIIYLILVLTDCEDIFFGGLCLGIEFGMVIVGTIMTSKYGAKIRAYKMQLIGRE